MDGWSIRLRTFEGKESCTMCIYNNQSLLELIAGLVSCDQYRKIVWIHTGAFRRKHEHGMEMKDIISSSPHTLRFDICLLPSS